MKETDIRPKKLYSEFLGLLEKEVSVRFRQVKFKKIDCPACNSTYYERVFKKFGFIYCECLKCRTIFVNPAPEDAAVKEYYRNSLAIKFLSEKIYKTTANIRKTKIFRPRAEVISNLIRKYGLSNYTVLDIGGGAGFLAQELSKFNIECQVIEPSTELAEICLSKHIKTHNVFLEEFDFKLLRNRGVIATSFELVEHLGNPFTFFKQLFKGVKKGSFLFFTTLSSTGFDIRVLWDKSSAFIPPLHLVFFNPESIKIFLKRIGFEIVNISTPGKLDWNIVEEKIRDKVISSKSDRFWHFLAQEGSEKTKEELQQWISKNGFSSHMMILARKP
ncbi:MAG: class I SAM-dependent methyltransferase [Candidatus Omnitrophica bacterium]|nr:class I SAM-dependent methyltransferase [Candidatus Omnitrophota bacterium]MDD5352381.1 class I SAM-dependent methyltransferase [Candidatus Omnitrophota bacterium]MDD5549979.1 class I SAM-dependent methyltransferase [Candidatus Omnitrophota bacterium]